MAGEVAVGGGVTDVPCVDGQAPLVSEEGGIDRLTFGGGRQGGADVGGGGDTDGTEQALVFGEGNRAEVADRDVRGGGEKRELAAEAVGEEGVVGGEEDSGAGVLAGETNGPVEGDDGLAGAGAAGDAGWAGEVAGDEFARAMG